MGVQCEPGGKKTRTDFRWSRLHDGDETQRKKSAQTVDKGAEILVTPRMEVPCSFIVHTIYPISLFSRGNEELRVGSLNFTHFSGPLAPSN
jgi:hypothetical protein